MSEKLEKTLKNLDFSESETKIYLFLLEYGSSIPVKIAKQTGILRTNTYNVLKNLENKGFIISQKTDSKTTYSAKHPDAIIEFLDNQRKSVESELLPDLIGLFKSQKSKPIVKFYSNKEEIIKVFEEMYEAEEVIYGITSTSKLFEEYGEFLKKWRKGLKTRGIFLKDILTDSSRQVTKTQTEPDLDVYFDYRFLPKNYDSLNVDILVWNDNVAIFTLSEPFVGTVLQNSDVADSFKMMHKIMWSTLKK